MSMPAKRDPLDQDLERLRRLKGFCPLTPKEADAELADAPEERLPPDEIESLLAVVRSGTVEPCDPEPVDEWSPEMDLQGMEEDVFALNRNAGEADPETDQLLEELRRKALGDDDEEPDGEDAGAAPPGTGG